MPTSTKSSEVARAQSRPKWKKTNREFGSLDPVSLLQDDTRVGSSPLIISGVCACALCPNSKFSVKVAPEYNFKNISVSSQRVSTDRGSMFHVRDSSCDSCKESRNHALRIGHDEVKAKCRAGHHNSGMSSQRDTFIYGFDLDLTNEVKAKVEETFGPESEYEEEPDIEISDDERVQTPKSRRSVQ